MGKNVNGQLGHGGRDEETVPRVVAGLRKRRIVKIAARGAHTLAVDVEGRVLAWGRGDEGQLGHGSLEDSLEPRLVEALVSARARIVRGDGSRRRRGGDVDSPWGRVVADVRT